MTIEQPHGVFKVRRHFAVSYVVFHSVVFPGVNADPRADFFLVKGKCVGLHAQWDYVR